MEKADSHLEASLQDLNDRVNELESCDDHASLMEAYVNRGNILSMLGLVTSAVEDLESACEIAEELESSGIRVDPGLYVRMHSSLASLLYNQGYDPVEEYFAVASRMPSLGSGSRHYDVRTVSRLCIDACSQLIDSGHPEDCEPFFSKGLDILVSNESWAQNRRVELLCLAGESLDEANDPRSAMTMFTEAIETASILMERGQLDDVDTLVLALAFRSEIEVGLGLDQNAIIDLNVAVEIMEGMLENHTLSDHDALVNLHHDLAGMLMKADRVEEAEKHLIRAMKIGIGQSSLPNED